MSAARDFVCVPGCDSLPMISAVPPTFNPVMRRLEGSPVARHPEQLQMHPALEELGWTGVNKLSDASRLKNESVPEPILITSNGTILAGFGRWRLAVSAKDAVLLWDCCGKDSSTY